MMRHGLMAHALIVALLLVGCAKAPGTATDGTSAPTGTATAGGSRTPDGGAPGSSTPLSGSARVAPKDYGTTRDLDDVHFSYDKYEIDAEAAKILDGTAAWLKSNADRLVLIEGHCDERGTSEYNVVLGERRAKATMNYLVAHGVTARRIAIISYGEERPMCTQHDEACWAKNRRAHFMLKRG